MTYRIGTSSFLWASGAALAGTSGSTPACEPPAGDASSNFETAAERTNVGASFPAPFFARPPKGADSKGSGSKAASLIEQLAHNDASVREKAVSEIVALGEEAVDPLIDALTHRNDRVRGEAVRALGMIGDVRATPHLIQRLQESKFPILQAVYEALEGFGAQAVPALTEALGDEDTKVRSSAAMMLGEIKTTSAVQPLLDALAHAKDEDIGHIADALAELGNPAALEPLEHMLERALSTKTRGKIMHAIEAIQDQATSDAPFGKAPSMEELVRDITSHLAAGLGLSGNMGISVGNVASYGTMTATGESTLQLVPRAEQRRELIFPDAWLRVDRGGDAKATQEMMRALNFLIHHEIAHRLQDERKIPQPAIDPSAFDRFDSERILHNANETQIDKLALLAARNVYIAPYGDRLFSANMREAIAVDAAVAFFGIVFRRHRSGERPVADEEAARASAVLWEMAVGGAVGNDTKRSLKTLAKSFEAIVIAKRYKEGVAQFRKLIRAYRNIFKTTAWELTTHSTKGRTS